MASGGIINHIGARGKDFSLRRRLNLAILACAVLPVVVEL